MSEPTIVTPDNFDLHSVMETLQDRQFLHIPIELVGPKKGFNHRRHFDEHSLTELAEDIGRVGITQPLVVRPNPEQSGFHLIAGERRLRAARMAGLSTVPAVVRLVSEAEAYAISVSENLQREDISAAEEAVIAHRAVGLSDGNRDEACRLLGWSRRKLDARLLLLHCDKSVLNALVRREIAVGHAELLAGLPSEMQAKTLPGLIERKVSVAELRESIGRYAYQLDAAVFETGDCATCINNSAQGADLFGETLGAGRCLNRECYDQKTLDWLAARREELKSQHAAVWLDTEKPADQRVYLVRDEVGREQYDACQSCANLGVLLHTSKGKEGQVESGLCFDTACHEKMVRAHREAVMQETASTKMDEHGDKDASGIGRKTSAPAKSTKATTKALSNKLEEYRDNLHYRAAAAEVPSDPHLIKILSLSALLNEVEKPIDSLKALLDEYKISTTDRAKTLAQLIKLDDAALDALTSAAAAALVGANHLNQWQNPPHLDMARQVLRHHDMPLDRYFEMSDTYLAMLTVAAIKALLQEAGFDRWLDGQEKGGYAAFLKKHKKKGDLVKAVMDAGFDWTGFVPRVMYP